MRQRALYSPFSGASGLYDLRAACDEQLVFYRARVWSGVIRADGANSGAEDVFYFASAHRRAMNASMYTWSIEHIRCNRSLVLRLR